MLTGHDQEKVSTAVKLPPRSRNQRMQLSERKQRKMDDNGKRSNASAASSDITFADDNRHGQLSDVTRPAITRPRTSTAAAGHCARPSPNDAKTSCRWDRSSVGNRPPEATTTTTKTAGRHTSSILSATCEPKTIGQTNGHRQFDRCIIHHDVVKRFAVATLYTVVFTILYGIQTKRRRI